MTDSDVVENDEELAARLHRELNGLNRRTGRTAAAAAVAPIRRRRARAAGSAINGGRCTNRPGTSPVGSSSGVPLAAAPGRPQDDQDTSTTPAGHEALLRDPYATSAYSAAATSRMKARLPVDAQPGPCLKCFVAGTRWGVAVKRSQAISRPLLAARLTSILSHNGDGGSGPKLKDNCSAVLLDCKGQQTHFPSTETHTLCAWESAVKVASRAYFM